MVLSPVRRSLYTGSEDHSIREWDEDEGSCKLIIVGHEGPIAQLAVIEDTRLISMAADNTIRVWHQPTGNPIALFQGKPGSHFSGMHCSDAFVFSSTHDGWMERWNLESMRVDKYAKAGDHGFKFVGLQTGKRYVGAASTHMMFVAGKEGVIVAWDTEEGDTCAYAGLSHDISAFSVGYYVVAGTVTGQLALWGRGSKSPRWRQESAHTKEVRSISEAGNVVVSCCAGGSAKTWELRKGQPLQTFPTTGREIMTMVVATASPRLVFLGHVDGTVSSFHLQSGAAGPTYQGRMKEIVCLELATDGPEAAVDEADRDRSRGSPEQPDGLSENHPVGGDDGYNSSSRDPGRSEATEPLLAETTAAPAGGRSRERSNSSARSGRSRSSSAAGYGLSSTGDSATPVRLYSSSDKAARCWSIETTKTLVEYRSPAKKEIILPAISNAMFTAQMMSFPFAIDLPWASGPGKVRACTLNTSSHDQPPFHKSLSFGGVAALIRFNLQQYALPPLQFMFFQGPPLEIWLLFAIVVSFTSMFTITVFLGVAERAAKRLSLVKHQSSSGGFAKGYWRFVHRASWSLCWLGSTLMFLPCTRIVLTMLDCTYVDDMFHLDIDPTVECFAGNHLIVALAGLATLVCYLPLGIRLRAVQGDVFKLNRRYVFNWNREHRAKVHMGPLKRHNLLFDAFAIGLNVALVAVAIFLNTHHLFLIVSFISVSFLLITGTFLFPSYRDRKLNAMVLSARAAILWTNLAALSIFLGEDWAQGTTTIYYAGLLPFALFTYWIGLRAFPVYEERSSGETDEIP